MANSNRADSNVTMLQNNENINTCTALKCYIWDFWVMRSTGIQWPAAQHLAMGEPNAISSGIKGWYSSSWEPHLRATGCHLPCGITHGKCDPTQVNAPRLTPVVQADTRFTYPWGMEGWVDLVDLIVPQPGVEPATFWSRVRHRTAAPPRQPHLQDNCVHLSTII